MIQLLQIRPKGSWNSHSLALCFLDDQFSRFPYLFFKKLLEHQLELIDHLVLGMTAYQWLTATATAVRQKLHCQKLFHLAFCLLSKLVQCESSSKLQRI